MDRILNICFFIFISILSSLIYADSSNPCLADIHSHVINKKTIWMDECDLKDKHVSILMSYLNQHPEITHLYLMNNKIGDAGAILIAKNKNLTMVELRNNLINTKGAIALANSSIQILDIKGNIFKTTVQKSRMAQLVKNNQITILG